MILGAGTSTHVAHHATQQSVTIYVLALVVIVVGWAGWSARRLWQANDDVKSLKRRLNNARRGRRRALVAAGLIGLAVLGMWLHWYHVNGG